VIPSIRLFGCKLHAKDEIVSYASVVNEEDRLVWCLRSLNIWVSLVVVMVCSRKVQFDSVDTKRFVCWQAMASSRQGGWRHCANMANISWLIFCWTFKGVRLVTWLRTLFVPVCLCSEHLMSLVFRNKQYDISDSAYKHFDFPAVREIICRVGHLSTIQ